MLKGQAIFDEPTIETVVNRLDRVIELLEKIQEQVQMAIGNKVSEPNKIPEPRGSIGGR